MEKHPDGGLEVAVGYEGGGGHSAPDISGFLATPVLLGLTLGLVSREEMTMLLPGFMYSSPPDCTGTAE